MKLRKLLFSLIFVIALLINIDCYALEGIVNGTSVRIRSGAGTSYSSLLDDAGNGNKYTLLDSKTYSTSDNSSGCSTGKWYKISYNNQVGYICSSFLNINSNESDNSSTNTITLTDSTGIIACYEDATSLPMRNQPAGYSIGSLNCGDKVEILDTDVSTANGCYSWYKIKSDGKTGYVCGKFVTTTSLSKVALQYYKNNSLDDYNKKLKNLGFPESYFPYLDELHARYPDWEFEAVKTGLDYSTVASLESAVGTSLIQGNEQGYRSTAGGSYNYYNDSFNVLDGSNWYAANYATISYYLDPRLYLKPNYIFMFEKLLYNSNYQTIDKVKNILSSTKLGLYDSNFANYYINAGRENNISPLHLAARTSVEIGSSTSVISGATFNYNGNNYSGLYNTYNIGAYSGADNWKKGLIYANGGEKGSALKTSYGRPWNSLEKAIMGGASYISNGYTSNKQFTIYLEKFNVYNGQSKVGVHEYMTNVRAPLSEASKVYNSYNSTNMLNNNFVFAIPVYNNMENTYILPNPGNPNNYLKELKINNSLVTGFDGAITDYDIYVSSATDNVNVSATTVNSGAAISDAISGTGSASGNISVKSGKNTIKVVVTALNGSKKTYNLNIYKDNTQSEPNIPSSDGNNVDFSTVIGKSGYKIDNNYISGININTKASDVVNSIKKNDTNMNVTIKNANGSIINNDIIGTGSTIEFSESDKSLTLTVIVYGDVSGDGKINALDLLKIQKHILEINKLKGVYLMSANASHDTNGTVNALDLLKVQKHILGLNTISQ